MSVKIETVKTRSFEMDYFRFGTGNRIMVIIPGHSLKSVMESADFVADGYSLFADEYTVYVFDRRKELPPVYNVHDMARDTAVAFDALGIKNAYLFGISLGGMIAEVIAAERPDLVCGMMLGSTCAAISDDLRELLGEWTELAENNRVTELSIGFAEAVYSEKLMKKNRRAFTYLADMTTMDELARFIVITKGMSGFDMSSHLYKIQCPVLVMGGGKDRLIGRAALEQLAEKTHGELYIYEDCTHSVYDEMPDFRKRTFDFFAKL